jgi:hypothetical protein
MVVGYRGLSAQGTAVQRQRKRIAGSVLGAAQQARLFVEPKSISRVPVLQVAKCAVIVFVQSVGFDGKRGAT